MNQKSEDDKKIENNSQNYNTVELERGEINDELLRLLKKINLDQKDAVLIIQLFGEMIKKVNQICEVYYEYEDYDKILSYYDAIYQKYLIAIDSLEDSEEHSRYYTPILRESFEYWKTRVDWLKKERARKIVHNGNLYLDEGKFETALYNFDNALKYDRNNQELLNKKGLSLFSLNRYDEALKCFEDASRLSEEPMHIFYNIALTYEQLKNIPKAIEFYNRVLKLDENHLYSMTSLGILYYREENYKLAKYHIQKAYQIQKNDWRILLVLGCIMSEGFEQYDIAKKHFEKSVTLNPSSLLIKLNLANVLMLLGEYSKSIEILTNVSTRIENVEDRSSAIILRILLICAHYLEKKEILGDLIAELIRYCNLKDLNLVNWNFKNLKNYIWNSKMDIDVKIKEILCSILSIPELDENNKKNHLDKILTDSKDILLKKGVIDIRLVNKTLSADTEQVEIIQEIEPDIIDKDSYNWRLYVKAPERIFSLIEYVEYILDPNYSKNIQRKISREEKFEIEGKGSFDSNFEVNIGMKDGSVIKKYTKLLFV